MSNITRLKPSENFTVEQALNDSLNRDLNECLVIGYDKAGDLFIRSSKMSIKDALWILEAAKRYTMDV